MLIAAFALSFGMLNLKALLVCYVYLITNVTASDGKYLKSKTKQFQNTPFSFFLIVNKIQ